MSDLMTLLFGAASIALFVFSIFIALLAIFGWQSVLGAVREIAEKSAAEGVKKMETDRMKPLEESWQAVQRSFRDTIDETIEKRIMRLEHDKIETMVAARKRLEYEVRGRALNILGYFRGEMSLDSTTLEAKDDGGKEGLAEAVQLCKQAYEYLKDLGEKEKYLALNNVVFYSCPLVDDSNRRQVVNDARLLRIAGELYGATNLLLTAGRAILRFGTDTTEKDEMRHTLGKLLTDQNISDKNKKEAGIYLNYP